MYRSENSKNVISWRTRKKYELIKHKGGKCERCGYSKLEYPNVFNFHHTNREEKDFTISGKSYSFERLKSEVDKCELLCSNCHAEIHAEPFQEIYAKILNPTVLPKREKTRCLDCGIEVAQRSTRCRRHSQLHIHKKEKSAKADL